MTDEWATSGVDLHLDLAAAKGAGGARAALESALRDAIRDGRLLAGARVPSTRALAAEVGLSRGTVTAAYDQLAAEGFLVPAPGSGTVVADLVAPRPVPPRAAVAPEPTLDLRPGSPDVSTFPVAAWLRATRRALDTAPPDALGYGDPRGSRELREALAGYLGRTRGVLAGPDSIVVTAGYVQALSLFTGALADVHGSGGGGTVAMEDPGLPFHREVVRAAGRRVVPLPVDEQGARVDLLAGTEAVAAVLTPAHQYPTGVALAPERRQAVARWAQDGRFVVEDDYDGEFRYDRQPVGSLQGRAPDGVVYVGSAAKTLAPGLRLAWMVVPTPLLEPVVARKRLADRQTEAVGQLTLAELLTSHAYDRHVRAMRQHYRRRRDLLLEVLGRRAGRHLRSMLPHSIAAGLQTVVRLPDPGQDEVVRRALQRDLALEGLAEQFHDGDGEPGLVIGFGRPRGSGYPRALEALGAVLP